ncbi:hypothetical protein [uncultured Ferrimonas sp.]|nr:hypothetical protein [uncultured Ferrimonas sp.]
MKFPPQLLALPIGIGAALLTQGLLLALIELTLFTVVVATLLWRAQNHK